jgi:hypothetical protein
VTHEIVYHIVDLIRRWSPELTGIEDTTGAQYLLSDLQRMAEDMRVPLKIDWFPVDSSPDAKDGRVKSLESLVHQKRLFFSSTIGCLEQLYQEFTGYGNESHDDIPDDISHLAVRHVRMLAEGAPAPETERERVAEEQRMDRHDLIYHQGRYADVEREPPPEPDPYALEELMGGLDG